ncbi:helix-turn-helix transcriptional regulator [Sphingobacterium siyangense]|uniref:helix-turn-helix transcriptional regulator n=1 Tax=Sphingobacterium siyangense TaxID=459529 RepID=UPI001964404B|nr:YafY family protein [Sphingobacterium siyangense]QRY58004.1 YafY family transcriptional regulator [Sphingobacterium siyangense]
MSMTDIQKRFDRILAIYMHLQAKPVVTAAALAERYEVSQRTIYRDIRSLMQVGIPIYGEAGSGYSLVEGYKMPPLQFTREEALSFVAAEKLVEKYTDRNLAHHFTTALLKMKAILRGNEKEQVAIVGDNFLVRGGRHQFNEKLTHGTNILIESIAAKKCVEIYYSKPSDKTPERREIEAVGIFVESKFWYVLAFCRLRKDYRQFRLDRINNIRILADDFAKEHPELSSFLNKRHDVPTTKVVVQVDKDMARYMEWDRHYFGFQKETVTDNYVEMHFESINMENGFARWYLMFADKGTIIEPESLKEVVKRLLSSALEQV